MFDVKELFQKSELIPVIVQDIHTRQVLMLGFANEEAVRKTFENQDGLVLEQKPEAALE